MYSAKSHLYVAIVPVALLLMGVAIGCGGSDETSSLTKAQFIKQADAACARADAAQSKALAAYAKSESKLPSSKAGQEEIVMKIGLPPVEVGVEEISALGAPDGEEDEVDALIAAWETAIEDAEADPLTVTKPAGNPFNEADKLAAAFGLKGCSEIL